MGKIDAETKVERGLEDDITGFGEMPAGPYRRWQDSINTIKLIHGEEELEKIMDILREGHIYE